MIMPLSLTLLSAAVPPERRNVALGIWGAIGGAAVAIGPLVGGAITSGWSWQYIFWLNVPIGVVLVPLAWWKLSESRGARARLDLVGVAVVSTGLLGVVLGLVEGNSHGWTSTLVLTSFVVGVLALMVFAAWELRSDHPMLDIRLFRDRGFTSVNVTAMLFSFGMFGAIFFLVQFLQTVQGLSPLAAGVRVLPWTAMPVLLAPVVGQLAERWGGKPLVVTGLSLQAIGLAWLATVTTPTTAVRRPGGTLRGLRRRDDPVLHPVGLAGAGSRAPGARGGGLGGQRRLPGAGWGARHRRARRHLHFPRQLRLGSGLRERDDRGRLRRCRCCGGGCSGSHGGPEPEGRIGRDRPGAPERAPDLARVDSVLAQG